ncbi:MAG: sigma-70 family RNA polymerase sigma factor [Phycisphaerae bacterium]|nr:sigma-70 family RNA polymerase sigma factor [Phycisphaerae bacterium]
MSDPDAKGTLERADDPGTFGAHDSTARSGTNEVARHALALIERMRRGDREAAAEFVLSNSSLIRSRLSRRMGRDARRVFDSLDLLSTIARRLDRNVAAGRLEARSEPQLWALIAAIGRGAVADRIRITRRARTASARIGLLARPQTGDALPADRSRDSTDLRPHLRGLRDTDCAIVWMWIRGMPPRTIADQLGMSEPALTKRWQRIRKGLRQRWNEGTSS